jgi:predicted transcriptional regulator YdeE
MQKIPPTLKYVEDFTVKGFSARTKNSDEFNEKTAKIPSLWQQLYSSELDVNATIFGIYSDYASDANGLYTITVGATCNSESMACNAINIQKGNYLVFQGEGPMPITVIETWKQIWDYFAKESTYQRNFITDFEAYSGSDKVAIYIGIQ